MYYPLCQHNVSTLPALINVLPGNTSIFFIAGTMHCTGLGVRTVHCMCTMYTEMRIETQNNSEKSKILKVNISETEKLQKRKVI